MTYQEFINNILNTRGRFNVINTYKERHHIIPRCMNGTEDENNLIDLTAEEHFKAHLLLANENPDNLSLQYALIFTVVSSHSNSNRYKPTDEEKEYLNKLNKKINSIKGKGRKLYHHKDTHEIKYFKDDCIPNDYVLGFPPEYQSPMKGHIWSEEHNKKLSISKKGKHVGKKWYNNGDIEILDYTKPDGFIDGRLPFSEETKTNIKNGILNRNYTISNETKLKLSNSKKGKHVYNNGIITIRSDSCPEGFTPGFIKKSKRKYSFYNNGTINKRIYEDEPIPEGFSKGMLENKTFNNRRWWTNGIENHWSIECPGEDYYLGRCKTSNNN